MKSKIHTPIGFLIELLHISVNDMAKTIFVDPTTVTKWKTSSRPLSSKCDSFDKVVDYILIRNAEQNRKTLENLFSSLYGDVPYRTKDYLKNCLCRFLENAVIPVEAKNLLAQAKGGLYSCLTSVYSGTDGRKTVMDIFLNEAEALDKPKELIFFDRQLFAWLMYDERYFRSWHKRIMALLEHGWDMTIIVDCTYSTDVLNMFLSKCSEFYGYPTYHKYSFIFDKNINLLPTTYVIKGVVSALGYNRQKSLYSCIFKDRVSVEQGYFYLQDLISECSPTISPKTTKERLAVYEKILSYESCDSPTYTVSTKPSLVTLSKDLMRQILRDNNIQGDIRTTMCQFHQVMRENFIKHKSFQRHLLMPEHLADPLAYERIYIPEIAGLIGKEIYITNEQYRQHIRDFVEFAASHENYSLALANPQDKMPTDNCCVRCKSKFYALGIGEYTYFNETSSIVQTTFSLIDKHWTSGIPPANKDKDMVLKRLLEVAEG